MFDLTQRNGVLCDFFRQIIHPCFDLSILSVTFTIKISTHMHTVTKNYCVTWNIRVYMLIAQAEQPGFKFRLFFFPRSVTNRRLGSPAHASLMNAYDTWNLQMKLSSCKATSSDAMISRAMKSHTNEHTVRSRPTLKVVKRFRKESVCKAYERSTIYERTF